ncbi:putative Mn2+ efflux pump MntP [Virgibacillus natechei]|uniref:Putative manganese efflux pump MntP n=1 Tax=Virgibacillus natechei TaxID=1216297 RepID=A0ABS4IG71_9BACI|nr:manganese efflux pump MntP family protein [Virgibacillus natechei]MBP1969863.1 putative Mn2+ efflux pump MntP [Virgibacillus natechei]UZD12607.1 manganese efflux pump MntP family protein [Virgibacillus natechei]
MPSFYIAEFASLLFMALALGMDAFSVCLGIGMQRIRLKRIALIGLVIGLFHFLMPFAGIILGHVISTRIGELTSVLGGIILFGIGAQMLFSGFVYKAKKVIQPIGFGLYILSFSVSIDSFSVGLSLGLSGVETALALFLFGTMSTFLAWTGMLVGKKVHTILGVYSEVLGGSILCGFGLTLLFG